MALHSETNGIIQKRSDWIYSCGQRYWGNNAAHVRALKMPDVAWLSRRRTVLLPLPSWAEDIGVGSPAALLVDDSAIASGEGNPFERCNWLAAAFFYLTGSLENSNATSYSTLIGKVDPRLFDHAWVNRIFLLLRRMAARQEQAHEEALFGKVPDAQFHITHDVDAIQKTFEIRCKQTAFHLFNAVRNAGRGELKLSREKVAHAARFFFTTPSYWNFERMRYMEDTHGLRSTFNFYGGPPGRSRGSLRRMIMDPGYDIGSPLLRSALHDLRDHGWRIGLHPSFDAWQDVSAMQRERNAVEAASGGPVTECRQHWLRFNWADTWRAQLAAGLTLDTTLGFNDRPGMRNGSALRFQPWDEQAGRALAIEAIPMLLMDSHFYDYSSMDAGKRRAEIARWTGEIRAVGGEASVNWHPHTMSPDYGWEAGYQDLLDAIT